MLTLVCTVGRDAKLLRRFILHYRALGVDRFLIIVNDLDVDNFRNILSPLGIDIVKVWSDPFTEDLKVKHERQVVKENCKPSEWILYADVDEFQEYEFGLPETLSACEIYGFNYLAGEITDRFAEHGELKAIDDTLTLDEQFPLRTDFSKRVLKSNTTKIAVAKAGLFVWMGHHYLFDEQTNSRIDPGISIPGIDPLSVTINHYKWDASVVDRMTKNIDNYADHTIGGGYWLSENLKALRLVKDGRMNLEGEDE